MHVTSNLLVVQVEFDVAVVRILSVLKIDGFGGFRSWNGKAALPAKGQLIGARRTGRPRERRRWGGCGLAVPQLKDARISLANRYGRDCLVSQVCEHVLRTTFSDVFETPIVRQINCGVERTIWC